MSSGTKAHGTKALTASAAGTKIALFRREPLATAQTTGSSRLGRRPAVCSALSATSSPSTPAVFCVATLVSADTSSSTVTMSSSRASRLEGTATNQFRADIGNLQPERRNVGLMELAIGRASRAAYA
jgi:hypothetical protein